MKHRKTRGCRAGLKKQKKKEKKIIGNGIINISGIDLTQEEIKTLDKGLKLKNGDAGFK